MSIMFALVMVLVQDKPAEKKPQICWESMELYDDTEFTKKMPEDFWIVKAYREKMPKSVGEVKTKAAKGCADKGVELVECPKHRLANSGLTQVAEDAKIFHLRIYLAHDWDPTAITIYAKFEIVDSDEKPVVTVKSSKSVGWVKVVKRDKRNEIIHAFVGKLIQELCDKLNEHVKEKK